MPSGAAQQHAYTFKITTPVHTLLRLNLDLPAQVRPGGTATATLKVTNTGAAWSRPTSVSLRSPAGDHRPTRLARAPVAATR
jgi:hypothetical protein